MNENRLKRLLREGKPAWGVWTQLGSASVAEALSQLDIDWILLDAEHGAAGADQMIPQLRAVAASAALGSSSPSSPPVTALVRVPTTEPIGIRRALDMGAGGVIVPLIKTAEEVAAAVAATRYPPSGTRGIGPFRASGYYTDHRDYYENSADQTVVVAQIETRESVENLEDILQVPGLDAVLIGPADLSSALGTYPDREAPEFVQAVARVAKLAAKAGVAAGYYCANGEEAALRRAEGFTMLSVSLDINLLTGGLHRALKLGRGE